MEGSSILRRKKRHRGKSDAGAFFKIMETRVRRALLASFCLIILGACQSQVRTTAPASEAIATASAPPAASAVPSAAPTSLFFDNFRMADAQSGWAWNGLSQLYRTDDGGQTWTEIHLFGKMLNEGGYFLDAKEAWLPGVAGADITQGVFHTTDGGKTWKELTRLHGPNLDLYFHDSKIGWAMNSMGAAGNIYYQAYQTEDGGQTWQQLHATNPQGAEQGPPPNTIRVASGDTLSFRPPDTVWITSGAALSTAYAGLMVSRDAGKTWSKLNPPLPADYLVGEPSVLVAAPQFVSDQDAYLPVAVGNRLIFFVSHDEGATWERLSPVLDSGQSFPRVQFVSVTDGFAVCGPNLCSTEDGGLSWKAIPTPFSWLLSSAGTFVSQYQFVDARTGWAILTDESGPRRFVKTSDGGRTWFSVQPRLGF